MSKSILREAVLGSLLGSSAPPREKRRKPPAGGSGLDVGRLVLLDRSGAAHVEIRGGRSVAARTTVRLRSEDVGQKVVLFFENGDPRNPVILGLMQPSRPRESVKVRTDRDTVIISAEREIVLQCGKSSLTLTRSGKVLIRGAYLSSQSSGVNRIKGGSVQIN